MPPGLQDRSNPPWRPSPSFSVPDPRAIEGQASKRPLESLALIEAKTANGLARQLEHAAALNRQTQQLVRRMECLLVLAVVFLACLLIVGLVLV